MPVRASVRRHVTERIHLSSQIGEEGGIAQNAPKCL